MEYNTVENQFIFCGIVFFCLAHILRKLTSFHRFISWIELNISICWIDQVGIHNEKRGYSNRVAATQFEKDSLDYLQLLLTSCIKRLWQSKRALIKHKYHVFIFQFNPNIPYDNNASKRADRTLNVKKGSGS